MLYHTEELTELLQQCKDAGVNQDATQQILKSKDLTHEKKMEGLQNLLVHVGDFSMFFASSASFLVPFSSI